MTDKKTSLAEIRQEIDEVDNKILSLLDQRSQIVERVKKIKTGHIFRPAREADMLRTLHQKYQGIYPFSAIYTIWREIIAATLRQEGKFNLVTLGDDQNLTKLCYHQFGVLTPLVCMKDVEHFFEKISNDDVAVGIVKLDDFKSWGADLYKYQKNLSIVGGLPYLTCNNIPYAMMISQTIPEPSKNDQKLYLEKTLQASDSTITIGNDLYKLTHIGNDERAPEGAVEVGRYATPIFDESIPF